MCCGPNGGCCAPNGQMMCCGPNCCGNCCVPQPVMTAPGYGVGPAVVRQGPNAGGSYMYNQGGMMPGGYSVYGNSPNGMPPSASYGNYRY